jgi:hypothetical protein
MTSAIASPTVPPSVLAEMTRADVTPMNSGGVDNWTKEMIKMRGDEKPIPARALLLRSHRGQFSIVKS